MKVLICDYNLHTGVGGGQSFFTSVVQRHSENEYYYLTEDEPGSKPPSKSLQAVGIPVPSLPDYLCHRLNLVNLDFPFYFYSAMLEAYRVGYAVQGHSFDIIEVPDYLILGAFIKPALDHFGVKYERLVLSMHGTTSTSARYGWNSAALDITRQYVEELSYRVADVRYCISKAYSDEWSAYTGITPYFVDPLQYLRFEIRSSIPESLEKPSLNFLGRCEKRKGPDIFLDLVSALPRHLFSRAAIYGDVVQVTEQQSSRQYLSAMARSLGLAVELSNPLSGSEMLDLFASPSVTFVPSRYDTLNLVGLESLFRGCPAVIGSGAGVVRYLRDTFPSIPFIEVDINQPRKCLPQLIDLLTNYKKRRAALVETLATLSLMPTTGTLPESVYAITPEVHRESNEVSYAKFAQFLTDYAPAFQPQRKRRGILARRLAQHLVSATVAPRQPGSATIANTPHDLYRFVARIVEEIPKDIDCKISSLSAISSSLKVDRARIWNVLADTERVRGNKLLYCVYKLRVMRALGEDRFGERQIVARMLREEGFIPEAATCEALYLPGESGIERRRALMSQASIRGRQVDHGWLDGFEIRDDKRGPSQPLVSVIVSLYRAASKLERFLVNLSRQTLLTAGRLEVILVDSGSPDESFRVFSELQERLRLPALYLRTYRRETIQRAWNRGIQTARAPYLAFLGVDEAVVDHGLERLARVLQEDPTIDWVTGNSTVYDVDGRGEVLREVMRYNRFGYHQDLVYLETCYLSWVGALYRRDIHERFGFYDDSFSAAGDTEFKSRVLPLLQSSFINEDLGLFYNYPDERATATPRAELEDLRAWYLFRTVEGIERVFAGRSQQDVEAQLARALSYRKSFLQSLGTDLEYASNLLEVLAKYYPTSPYLQLRCEIVALLSQHRANDYLTPYSPVGFQRANRELERLIDARMAEPVTVNGKVLTRSYAMRNDNRFEQHEWPWEGRSAASIPVINHRSLWG